MKRIKKIINSLMWLLVLFAYAGILAALGRVPLDEGKYSPEKTALADSLTVSKEYDSIRDPRPHGLKLNAPELSVRMSFSF